MEDMVPRRCLRRAIAELKNILAQFAPTPALRRVEITLELGQWRPEEQSGLAAIENALAKILHL